MRRSLISLLYLTAAGIVLAAIGMYGGFASLRGVAPSEMTFQLLVAMLCFMLVCWIIEDSRGRENIYRPFCFGFLLWIYLLPYTPYYIIKTRGAVGLLWFLGALALIVVGSFVPLMFASAR